MLNFDYLFVLRAVSAPLTTVCRHQLLHHQDFVCMSEFLRAENGFVVSVGQGPGGAVSQSLSQILFSDLENLKRPRRELDLPPSSSRKQDT